jgi:nitrite reductase/ring-hydroxylating ferredoxin subunit
MQPGRIPGWTDCISATTAAFLRVAFSGQVASPSVKGDIMSTRDTFVTLDELPEAIGFPFKVMPTSWFQIGWSEELASGDVRPLKYFNKDLVLFRTQDGKANLTSAFCPHMGAHLGFGGRVEGNELVCPYHGWHWGSDGYNKLVPSEGCASTSRRMLKVWTVAESNGCIWAWHDAVSRAPLWDPPPERRHERNYLPVFPHATYKWEAIRTQPQFVAENTVDLDHLIFVHGSTLLPLLRQESDLPEHVVEGHIWRNVRKPPLQNSTNIGIGIVQTEFPFDSQRPHRLPTLLFHCTTPIDNQRSDMFGTVLVEQDAEAEGGDGLVPVGRALKRVKEQIKQAGHDVPIWDHMVYMERPAYSRLEGVGFIRLRRWARQFYPDVPETPAAESAEKRTSA